MEMMCFVEGLGIFQDVVIAETKIRVKVFRELVYGAMHIVGIISHGFVHVVGFTGIGLIRRHDLESQSWEDRILQ